MSERKSRGSSKLLRTVQVGLLCAVAAGLWYYENVHSAQQESDLTSAPPIAESNNSGDGAPAPAATPSPAPLPAPKREDEATPATTTEPATVEKVNGYDRLRGAELVDHRNNDGDSFQVRHGDRQFELRLYYADSPEKYLSDRYADQRARVADQARDLGGLSIDDTVALGVEAREHVRKLLAGQSFSVFTRWEQVYDGDRYYGFVLLPGEREWLSENLVENGLARIHTKGERTPDGKSYREYRDFLESLEEQAKAAGRGAWRN